MNKAYKMQHFDVRELIPPAMHSIFGGNGIRYIDIRLIANLNAVREWLDAPMTINNWHAGGGREESGLRLPGMKHYSKFSAHSFGMAFDAVGEGIDRARSAIIRGDLVLPYPCRIELGVNWLHMDVMNCLDEKVVTFSP